jgi:fatty acid desaturase
MSVEKVATKDEYFRELSETPTVSWPALLLFVLAVTTFVASTIGGVSGTLPILASCLINGFALYLFFSPMHDALHGSASKYQFLNELIGRLSLVLLIPAAPLEIARWVHLRHHAHTTADIDPDNFMHHGKWWVLPFRWANFDFFYIAEFFKNAGPAAERSVRALIVYLSVFLGLVVLLVLFGYGLELLVLWLIPSRIGLALVGFVFVFLPHYPADISARENKYQATTTRLGWEWVLTPLMVYQNYHLVHHLYPNIPFYNYIKVWHLRYEEITKNNPAIQTAFGLGPINR